MEAEEPSCWCPGEEEEDITLYGDAPEPCWLDICYSERKRDNEKEVNNSFKMATPILPNA